MLDAFELAREDVVALAALEAQADRVAVEPLCRRNVGDDRREARHEEHVHGRLPPARITAGIVPAACRGKPYAHANEPFGRLLRI